MGPIAVVDIGVQRACDIHLERIGEGDRVARGANDVGEDAVVLGDMEGAVMILNCHVNCGLAEETTGVAETGAFHEAACISSDVR